MRLRSTAPALLLQSPVQRAGRAGRPSEASPYASAHDSREGRLVLASICHIKRASLLGVELASASDAHIAARCAPGAPQGEIYTLGEHWSRCDDLGRHARHGAPLYVFRAVLQLGASARI